MNTKSSLKKIELNGYVILENVLNIKKTKIIKKKLEKILDKRLSNNEVIGHHDNQVMYNYFNEDISLLKLIYFPKIDLIQFLGFLAANILPPASCV